MTKSILSASLLVIASLSFADVPSPIKMKCTSNSAESTTDEKLYFEYGAGQKSLSLPGLENLVVEVTNAEGQTGLLDVKVYLKDSIVSAKGVSVSADQTNGFHIVFTAGTLSSLTCGI